MNTPYFCTYFDHNFLARGLTLYNSLEKHNENFKLIVLCLTEKCFTGMQKLNLSNAELITLNELEKFNPELLIVKTRRTIVEYYFTCTSFLIEFALKKYEEIDLITYLDSDLYFFNSPKPIFELISDSSVCIIEHKFAPEFQYLESRGKYNVGWLSFRRDKDGLNCLKWYKDRCLEWCYDRLEDNKYADQKYLDEFAVLFDNINILKHKGANLAPWNIGNFNIAYLDNKIKVDEDELIFYHFHGLRYIFFSIFSTGLTDYNNRLTATIRTKIYLPYIEHLILNEKIVANHVSYTKSYMRKKKSFFFENIKKLKTFITILLKKTYIKI